MLQQPLARSFLVLEPHTAGRPTIAHRPTKPEPFATCIRIQGGRRHQGSGGEADQSSVHSHGEAPKGSRTVEGAGEARPAPTTRSLHGGTYDARARRPYSP